MPRHAQHPIYRSVEAFAAVGVLLFTITAASIFHARFLNDQMNWGDDWGLYMQIAHNLAHGLPYNHLIQGISATPGFPVLLWLTASLSSWNFADLKLLNVASWGLLSLTAYALGRLYFDRLLSLLVAWVVITLPSLFQFQSVLNSDLVGASFSVAALWAHLQSMRWLDRGRNFWGWAGATITLCLAALLIRPAALPVILAILADNAMRPIFWKKWRSYHFTIFLYSFAMIAVVVAYGVTYWDSVLELHLVYAGFGAKTPHPESFRLILAQPYGPWRLVELLYGRLGREVTNLAVMAGYFPVQHWLGAVLLTAIPLSLASTRMRREPGIVLFVCGFGAMLILASFSAGYRYWIPVFVPLLILCVSVTTSLMQAILRGLGVCKRQILLPRLIVALLLIAWVGFNTMQITRIADAAFVVEEDVQNDPALGEFFLWVRNNVPEGDLICGYKGRVLMYMTQRGVCGTPLAIQDISVQLSRFMKKNNARFISVPTLQSSFAKDALLGREKLTRLKLKADADPDLILLYSGDKFLVYGLKSE